MVVVGQSVTVVVVIVKYFQKPVDEDKARTTTLSLFAYTHLSLNKKPRHCEVHFGTMRRAAAQ